MFMSCAVIDTFYVSLTRSGNRIRKAVVNDEKCRKYAQYKTVDKNTEQRKEAAKIGTQNADKYQDRT